MNPTLFYPLCSYTYYVFILYLYTALYSNCLSLLFNIISIRTNLSLYTFDAPFISLPSTTWWRLLFSCYFSPCGVQMRLRGLFSSCVQPPALNLVFELLRTLLGIPQVLSSPTQLILHVRKIWHPPNFEGSCNYGLPLKVSFFQQGSSQLSSHL